MIPKLTWRQASAWRMARHLLEPVGRLPVEAVVQRPCGVQAQVASSAELAVRVRQQVSAPGDVGRALADGRLIKTWAMRGTLHLLTPVEGAAVLSLIAAARTWERPSWQRYFGLTPAVLEELRVAVREELTGRVLTREELIAALIARPQLAHLAEGLRSGWGTLFKPLTWQGDMCFGPNRGARVTFMRPEEASSRWPGLPDSEVAAPAAISAYLRAYAPATIEAFAGWLGRGSFGKRQMRAWTDALGDRLAEVDVDGERGLVLADDLDEMLAARPTDALRLLPGFDQYVLGPGTDDTRVIPAARRHAVSRQSGWISPVVVVGGVVAGTWELKDETVAVAWFREAGDAPRHALDAEVARLGTILRHDLAGSVELV